MKRVTSCLIALVLVLTGCVSRVGVRNEYLRDEYCMFEIVNTFNLEFVLLTAPGAPFHIPMPSAPGTNAVGNALASIDFSNSSDGYVIVSFLDPPPPNVPAMVIVVAPDGKQWTYPIMLAANETCVIVPLAFGNGSYNIVAAEIVSDGRASSLIAQQIDVRLSDVHAPFLRPNRWVNYTLDSNVVKKSSELLNGVTGLIDRVRVIYNFVVASLTYNYDLAAQVTANPNFVYIPDLDRVLASGKGICFDYASIMAAMLRSQGVITRMVWGWVQNPQGAPEFHAWIDVYSDVDGWLNGIVFFDGKGYSKLDPTWASSAGEEGERHAANAPYEVQQFR